MTNYGRFIPTVLLPEIYFPYAQEKGFIAHQVERVAEEGFYQAVEIGSLYDQEDRKHIFNITSQAKLLVTQWMTDFIEEKGVDLSSFDSRIRKEGVALFKAHLYAAAECGAANVAFISGPDSGEDKRAEATLGFYESMCEICEEASTYGLTVLVEPLDRFAHKKRFLGPTSEAVQIIGKVRESHANMGLAFDTAHAALNGEKIEDVLELARFQIHQLHFSNAVLDKNSTLYGDFHMPIGKPGFLDSDRIGEILQKVEGLTPLSDKSLRIAIEVRGKHEINQQANEKINKAILKEALKKYEGLENGS